MAVSPGPAVDGRVERLYHLQIRAGAGNRRGFVRTRGRRAVWRLSELQRRAEDRPPDAARALGATGGAHNCRAADLGAAIFRVPRETTRYAGERWKPAIV